MVFGSMDRNDSSTMIKNLASCNKISRDKSLKLFNLWLPLQDQVSDDDMKKIWKGLFYCVWHADKSLVQSELIDNLSALILRLDHRRPLALHYFSIFLLTIHREWSGIDSLRLDKFYLLIRRFMHHCFLFLKNCLWGLEVTREFIKVLEERTLLGEGKFPSNGVNYHVASVFIEELKHFLPTSLEVLDVLFLWFLSVMGKSSDKVLLSKIKSNVFDVLVTMGRNLLEVKKSGDEIDESSEVVVLGTIALTMKLSSRFYELGSSTGCLQGSRKALFGLHEEFLKLEKDLENSGFEISIPKVNKTDGNEEEVPSLVPIEMDMDGGVSQGVVKERAKSPGKKKHKKEKKGLVDGSGKKKAKAKEGSSSDLVVENCEEVKASESAAVANSEILNGELVSDEVKASENADVANGENSKEEVGSDVNFMLSDETVISNLQMQFEKVAADAGLDKENVSLCGPHRVSVNGHVLKKRKRAKSLGGKDSQVMDMTSEEHAEGEKNAVKSAKKVKFSMKSNLVWKPHNPLPPQSLRLPPSVTPRGSALKKGVPPGPIREMSTVTKKAKAKAKKGRKSLRSISPAVKRLKKLKSVSV